MPKRQPVCGECGYPLEYSNEFFGICCPNCKKGLEIANPVDLEESTFNSFEIELEKDPRFN